MRILALAVVSLAVLAPALPAAPSVTVTATAGREHYLPPELVMVSSLDAREELLDAAAGGTSEGGRDWAENPAAMGLASLVVPGSGQLIQGNRRGYLYLLAEAALWGGFYVLDQKGSDKRDEYEAYAEANWAREEYLQWYQTNCVECENCAGEYDCRPLATYGTQEYYEDIGKYDTYWRWWNLDGDEGDIGWDEYGAQDLNVRNYYWDLRGDSNRYLRRARYATMVVLLNHIVSAVDAFFTARTAGPDGPGPLGDLGIEFDVADGGDGLTCALTKRY